MTTTTTPSGMPTNLKPTSPVVPTLPENAPFSTAQRAWLNGFFAGVLGSQPAASGLAPQGETAGGPAEADDEDFPWHDPAVALAERQKMAADKPYARQLMAAMAQLDCGACGYVCQFYAEAIANGSEKDLTRCTPGGRDTSRALKQLVANPPKNVVPVSAVGVKRAVPTLPPNAATAPTTWDRNSPYAGRLLASKPLNIKGSSKDTRLVEIDLRGSGLSYKPGDALGVFPENCPDLVRDLLGALGATGAEDVPGWDGAAISLHDALLRDFTVTRPTPDLLDVLSRCATDDRERDALQALRDSEDGAGDLHVLDLLRRYPSARPAICDFVATLSPLAPRLYSISSSLRARPDQAHLTVGAVRYDNSLGRACGGVASTFLCTRVRPGQKVRIYIHPSHKFALPGDSTKPVVMVGPGTGIAPFRAFLQERAAGKCAGKNWLFFGDQKSTTDFLYRDELEAYQKAGVLTRLDTAFSRDQAEKVYVQTRMLEAGADLWQWLQSGAHFYVCGDAQRMASDVDKALRHVVAQHGAKSPEEADAYVSEMIRGGRYQRDVY